MSLHSVYTLEKVCKNPTSQVNWVTGFCTMVPNICWSSVWILVHVTFLVPRIVRWMLDFSKSYVPLNLNSYVNVKLHFIDTSENVKTK